MRLTVFHRSKRNVVQLTVEVDDDEEYECVQDAISLGLARLGVESAVTSSDLEQSFCYDQGNVIAEIKAQCQWVADEAQAANLIRVESTARAR